MLRLPQSRLTTAALLLTTLPAITPAGQEEARAIHLESLDVSDNVYLLRGGGTNTLAVIAEAGVVLVDTLGAGWGPATRAALNNLTNLPVTTIINTHAHAGHTGGNVEFASVVEIVAHENTKRRMEQMEEFQGANARFLPTTTFRDSLSILDGFDRIELRYFGAAHTDGDIVVVFPEKGMAYLGDLFARTAPPSIDRAAGGSGAAYTETLSRTLDELRYFTEFVRGPEIRTFDRIVPGHQEPPDQTPLLRWFTWADLERYTAFTREFVDLVTRTNAAGRTLNEAVAQVKPLAGAYEGYTLDRAERTVQAIYDELADR